MSTPKKKQSYGDAAAKAYENYGDTISQIGDEQLRQVGDALGVWREKAAAIEDARQTEMGKVREGIVDSINSGNTAIGAILKEAEQKADDYEKYNEAQRLADQRAARWAGASELAASLVNMIGVGSFGASNQQYHSYSQDWMKKADEDYRQRLARVDNLRERQRAIQQQQLQMKMSGDQRLAAFDTGEAGTRFTNASKIADADRDTILSIAKMRTQLASDVAKARLQGETEKVKMDFTEDDHNKNRAVRYSRTTTGGGKKGEKKGGGKSGDTRTWENDI